MKTTGALFIVFTVLLFQPATHAQTHRASIRGTITDEKGAVIPGATVKATNIATNENRSVISESNGAYAITSLPSGSYRLEAQGIQGFEKFVRDFILQVNQEFRLDILLKIAAGQYQVVVEDSLPLKKDSVSLSTVIEGRQITQLPLDVRNFLELSLLVPGAVPDAPG